MDLQKTLDQITKELDQRKLDLDVREQNLQSGEDQLKSGQDVLEQKISDLETEKKRVSGITDIIAYNDAVKVREDAVRVIESDQAEKSLELQKYENDLFTIKQRQDTKDTELNAREMTVSDRETNYKQTLKDEFLKELQQKLG